MRIYHSRVRFMAHVACLLIGIILVLAAVRPLQATAAEDTEAIDLNRSGTIRIQFLDGQTGKPFSFGTKVGIFRVADIKLENGLHFVYDELFESVGKPPTMASQYNDELADRLEEIALFKGISLEVPSEEIREDGYVTFSDLTPGLFLIIQMYRGTDSPRYQVRPFIVTLPVKDADGSFVYDIEMEYRSRDHGQGTASLINKDQTMIDSSAVPAPEEGRGTKLPVAVICIAAGIVFVFLITRRRAS